MRRVAVVGCSGAGKSRLARTLASALGVPAIHLDAEFWRPGWVETPFDEWSARQAELFAGDAWVADGNFHRTIGERIARADTIVHLDLPRRTCLRGVLGRWWRHHGEVRDDMAAGCPEKLDLEFLHWVWRFRRDVRPHVLCALAGFEARGGRVVTLRSRADADRWMARIVAERGQAPPHGAH